MPQFHGPISLLFALPLSSVAYHNKYKPNIVSFILILQYMSKTDAMVYFLSVDDLVINLIDRIGPEFAYTTTIVDIDDIDIGFILIEGRQPSNFYEN